MFLLILLPFPLQASFSLKKAAKEISRPVETVTKPVKEIFRESKASTEKQIVLCPDPPCREKKDTDNRGKAITENIIEQPASRGSR